MIDIDLGLIRKVTEQGKRLDNRQPDEYRNIEIEKDVIYQAEGSAKAKIGETEVLVGVKMSVGKPYPDSFDEGTMSVSAELVPFASPEFEAGPPGEQSIELARVVDRAIRESKMIDLKKLCIKEHEHSWTVNIDIHVMNDDGNLIDTACLAATAALVSTKVPKIEITDDKIEINRDESSGNLPIRGTAITTTFIKVGSTIFADPSLGEINAMDASLSVGTLENKLCSMQKGGYIGFTPEEIEKIADLAIEKGDELRKKLESVIMK